MGVPICKSNYTFNVRSGTTRIRGLSIGSIDVSGRLQRVNIPRIEECRCEMPL